MAAVNSAAMNIGVHASFRIRVFIFSGYSSRSGITYGSSVFSFFFFFFYHFSISWAAPAAYGGSQARGPIGAIAASLRQSHSNTGSEPHL